MNADGLEDDYVPDNDLVAESDDGEASFEDDEGDALHAAVDIHEGSPVASSSTNAPPDAASNVQAKKRKRREKEKEKKAKVRDVASCA